LQLAAQRHSDHMSNTGCFNHHCPGEPSPGDRVKSAGYQWSGVGENIAVRYRDCRSVVAGWMGSQGHRNNILGNYRHIGCGRRNDYWTCDFGNP